MALLPALIWALLAYYRHRSILQLAILAVTFTLLIATHRLAVLLSIVFVSFLAASVALMALRILRLYFPRLVLQNSFRRVAPHLSLLGIIAIAAVMLFGTKVLDQYTSGELASGTQPQVQIFNLGISIARSSGVALPLALAGLVVTTRQWNKTLREPFLALSFLGFIPTLLLRDYAGFYVLPILAILGGLGFWGIIELFKKRPRVVVLVAVTLTLVVASFSTYVLGVEVDRTPEIASTTYDTSLYGKMMGTPYTFISNEGLTGVQFASISGGRILPVGGAGTGAPPRSVAREDLRDDRASPHSRPRADGGARHPHRHRSVQEMKLTEVSSGSPSRILPSRATVSGSSPVSRLSETGC